MLLVRQFGGDLQQQIGALLHDVSHTAFSHVIDYVFGGHDSQSYHEEVKEAYLAETDIPAILKRFDFDWYDYLHEEQFPLLEQSAPALCADRLDYFLRDSYDLRLASLEQIKVCIRRLVAHQGRLATFSLEAARWMAETYILADEASWANFREVGIYELTARAIRRGLELGALTQQDLWTTDAQAWEKLKACPDPVLQQQIRQVSTQTNFIWDDAHPTFYVSTKLRTLDPDVVVDGRMHPLSDLDSDFARRRQAYLQAKAGKWPMRVVSEQSAEG
jgi:hypothetical protein